MIQILNILVHLLILQTKKSILEVKEEPKIKPAEDIINEIINKYQSSEKCLEHTAAGWNYKVCLGESILQTGSTPDLKFVVGKYSGIDSSDPKNVKIIFNGGDICTPQGARTANLSFTCGNDAKIHSMSEPATCKYSFIIQVPEVCGHPAFPATAAEVSSAGSEESWMLEIVKLFDSSIMCTAQHSGIGKMDKLFFFKDFSLQFDSGRPKEYRTRKANRVPLATEEIEVLSGGIQSSLNFRNSINFVSITMKSQDTTIKNADINNSNV